MCFMLFTLCVCCAVIQLIGGYFHCFTCQIFYCDINTQTNLWVKTPNQTGLSSLLFDINKEPFCI